MKQSGRSHCSNRLLTSIFLSCRHSLGMQHVRGATVYRTLLFIDVDADTGVIIVIVCIYHSWWGQSLLWLSSKCLSYAVTWWSSSVFVILWLHLESKSIYPIFNKTYVKAHPLDPTPHLNSTCTKTCSILSGCCVITKNKTWHFYFKQLRSIHNISSFRSNL